MLITKPEHKDFDGADKVEEGFPQIETCDRRTLIIPHELESEPVAGWSEDHSIGSEVDCREDCHDDTTQMADVMSMWITDS